MTPHQEAGLKTAAIVIGLLINLALPVYFGVTGLVIIMLFWMTILLGGLIFMLYMSFLYSAENRRRREENDKNHKEIMERFGKRGAK